jgi:hypothetical protein
MKPFIFCKLPIVLLCLGGALVLAPQSRAQSEIAPDHFDGTDSWAAATSAKAPALRAKPQAAPAATSQARNNVPAAPALEPIAARSVTVPRRSDAIVTSKRKPAAPKPNN